MPREFYTIALVNYLNARPFLHGLHHGREEGSFTFDIRLLNPAECARSFMKGEADIALVPAGSLHHMTDYKRVTGFGIAAEDEVRTVCLFSNDEPSAWKEIILDDHSMTSVLLTRLIISNFFNINPVYKTGKVDSVNPGQGQAVLMIGDKVFNRENDFLVRLDLAAEWKKWTKLPFVFAVWVAKPHVPEAVLADLEKMLSFGVNHIEAVIPENTGNTSLLKEYYQKYIRYNLEPDYLQGLEKYLELSRTLVIGQE